MLIRSVWPECLSGERQRLRAAGRGRKMKSKTIGFIGLGLIGGSLAKALRRVYPELTLIGYNRSRASLVAALEDGTLNQAQDTVGGLFAACDMVFLCAPVEVNIACMERLKGILVDRRDGADKSGGKNQKAESPLGDSDACKEQWKREA